MKTVFKILCLPAWILFLPFMIIGFLIGQGDSVMDAIDWFLE